jgi:hypothetical protein
MFKLRRCRAVAGKSLCVSGARLEAIWAVAVLTLAAVAVCAFITPGPVFAASDPAIAALGANATAGGPSTEGPSKGTVLASLTWGDGAGQVGLISSKEGLTRGPEALAVAPDGRIAILDSVNRRLVLLDQNGRALGKIELPLAQPRFLAVDDQTLYVIDADADRRLATFTWSGKAVATTALPGFDDVVTGLFATSEGACVEIAHQSTLLLGSTLGSSAAARSLDSSRGSPRKLEGRPLDRDIRRVARTTYKPKDGVRIHTGTVNRPDLVVAATTELQPRLASGRAIEHLVSVDGDGRGGVLVGARLLRPEVRGSAKSTLAITRLAPDAGSGDRTAQPAQTAEGSVMLLAESGFAYLGQPYVVAPDGRVFQPFGTREGYTIVVHSFTDVQP